MQTCNNSQLSGMKRKPLEELTNVMDFMPKMSDKLDEDTDIPGKANLDRNYQNVHPLLPWYKHDLETTTLSYDRLQHLLHADNEVELIDFLTQLSIFPSQKQCVLCGGGMRRKKDGKHWFWICTRRVDGVKCNKGKRSIRTGTIFDNRNLSIQEILLVFWHYIHHLTVLQCAQFTNITQRNNTTVCYWYKVCREICTEWFWDPINTPKLGGFGKIVEMDESFFPGKPKYNRGRRLGEGAWKEEEKWVFGMTERGSLDAIAIQVPSNRSRVSLMPIIDQHCNAGTIFCSDGWKAYNKLADHLNLDDVLHYPVNHSENYVDPGTGAHTQTIEGFWRQVKAWLPDFGMKPRDLPTYLGAFLWFRYCKQRKLDQFIHLLKCISEKRPFENETLPGANMSAIEVDQIDI